MNATTINAIRTAFERMALAALDYSKAAETVRKLRAQGAPTDEVRELCQAALAARCARYRAQVHAESGKPVKGSAYQRAVSRMMRDTDPMQGERVNHAAKAVRVPRNLQAALDKLVAEFGKQAVREGVKRVSTDKAE